MKLKAKIMIPLVVATTVLLSGVLMSVGKRSARQEVAFRDSKAVGEANLLAQKLDMLNLNLADLLVHAELAGEIVDLSPLIDDQINIARLEDQMVPLLSDEGRKYLADYALKNEPMFFLQRKIIQAMKSGDLVGRAQFTREWWQKNALARDSLADLTSLLNVKLTNLAFENEKQTKLWNQEVYALLGLTSVFFLILFIYLNFIVLRPLKIIENGIKKLPETDVDFGSITSTKDEFFGVASALNDLASRLRETTVSKLKLEDEISRREVLEKKLIEAKAVAVRASQEKSDFLANMSHEIRTPLTSITGYSDLLLEEEDLSDGERQEFLRTISRSGAHLSSLISDILDVAKIESGNLVVETIEFDFKSEIDSVMDCLRLQVEKKGLDLTVSYDSFVPAIIVSDPTRFRQILFNLVGNSVKFTNTGSVNISVRTGKGSDGGEMLFVKVVDSGIGVAPELHSSIFKPFSQGDSTTTRKFGGTGLGLDLSRKLARKMGGDVQLKCSSPGGGSTFIFSMKVRSDVRDDSMVGSKAIPKIRPERTLGKIRALTGRSVLVIDDCKDIQRLFQSILVHAGATVDVAGCGATALKKVVSTDYDIILLDLQMPDMDGYRTAFELRSGGVRSPIVALTASASLAVQKKCLNFGFNAYKSKPITPRALVELVDSWTTRVFTTTHNAKDQESRFLEN